MELTQRDSLQNSRLSFKPNSNIHASKEVTGLSVAESMTKRFKCIAVICFLISHYDTVVTKA